MRSLFPNLLKQGTFCAIIADSLRGSLSYLLHWGFPYELFSSFEFLKTAFSDSVQGLRNFPYRDGFREREERPVFGVSHNAGGYSQYTVNL